MNFIVFVHQSMTYFLSNDVVSSRNREQACGKTCFSAHAYHVQVPGNEDAL